MCVIVVFKRTSLFVGPEGILWPLQVFLFLCLLKCDLHGFSDPEKANIYTFVSAGCLLKLPGAYRSTDHFSSSYVVSYIFVYLVINPKSVVSSELKT